MPEKTSKKLSPLFMVVFLIFGLVGIAIAFQTFKMWKIQNTWPTTTGVVVKTAKKGWWDEEKQFRYYLAYKYQINGSAYTGTQFHIKEHNIKRYTYLIRGYEKGDSIKVWYNPQNPAEAVICAEYLRDGIGLLIVMGSFLFFASTMLLKENIWQRQVKTLISAIPKGYQGKQPLPSSKILHDAKGVLTLNTGLSIFWSWGVPFFGLSFVTLFFMLIFLDEINPGWTFANYFVIMLASWIVSFLFGFVIKKGFEKKLIIHARKRKILEISSTFFVKSRSMYNFSDIHELKLHRDQWHITNTLKNWILYLHTKDRKSIFISFRHRDIQPAKKKYLEILKTRIECLLKNPADVGGPAKDLLNEGM